MTLKNSFCNPILVLDAIRKKIWVFIIVCVVFFFALPIGILLKLQVVQRSVSINSDQFVANISSMVQNFFFINNTILGVLMVAIGIMSGIAFFYYLHDKKKVDFFHSLPISSKNLFFINYLAGLLSVVIPYIVSYLIAIGITAAYGGLQYLGLSMAIKGLIFPLIYFINCYSITVLAGVLTGNIIIHGCVSLYLLMVIPVVCLELQGLMSVFLKTYVSMSPWIEELMFSISPLFSFFNYIENVGWGDMVIYLITTMLALILTAFLYSKRQGEAAGKAIAFSWFKPLVKYPLIILGAIGFGLLFHVLGDDNRYTINCWLIFGAIAGGILISRLMEVIFAFDVKEIKKHWLNLIVSLAVVGCIFAFFALDLGGYDSYVPNTDDVAEVSIQIDGMNMFGFGYYETTHEYNKDQYVDFFNGYLQDSDNIKNVVNIAKNGITNLDEVDVQKALILQAPRDMAKEGGNSVVVQSSENKEQEYTTNVTVKYVLNNGKVINRLYPIVNKVDTVKDVELIITSQEYRDNALRFLSDESLNVDSFAFTDTAYSFYADSFSPEGKQTLIDAYTEDVKTLDVTSTSDEKVVGIMQFNNMVYSARDSQYKENTNKTTLNITAPIYLSFTKTLGVLNEMGYDIETYGILNPASITKITMHTNYFGSERSTEKVLLKEEYADLLATTASDYQLRFNYFTAAADPYTYEVDGSTSEAGPSLSTTRLNIVDWTK